MGLSKLRVPLRILKPLLKRRLREPSEVDFRISRRIILLLMLLLKQALLVPPRLVDGVMKQSRLEVVQTLDGARIRCRTVATGVIHQPRRPPLLTRTFRRWTKFSPLTCHLSKSSDAACMRDVN